MLIYTFILVDLNIQVSDQVIAMLCQVNNYVATFRDDDDVRFVLDQQAWLYFYSAS
jgi:hypothetical protein